MRRALGAVAASLLLLLAACGSTSGAGPAAPWAAEHPDPKGMHFADAQGLCAVTVQYPNEAPGEIDYQGRQYIQRSRGAGGASSGAVVARSGDWTLRQPRAGELVLDTGSLSYDYRSGSKCGSNSAPPS